MGPSISFPLSGLAAIKTLDGSNWPFWASHITALLHMNGLKLHLTNDPSSPTFTTSASGQAASTTATSGQATTAPDKDWLAKEEMVLGVLEMYTQKDV